MAPVYTPIAANAIMRVQIRRPTASTTSSNTPSSRMPTDNRQKPGAPPKPFTPSLSSNFRTSKTPLAPKLASSLQSTPASSPRRGLQPPPATTPTIVQSRNNVPTPTPTASPLNGNITPRSAARLSRAQESPSAPTAHVKPPSRPTSTLGPTDRGLTPAYETQGLAIVNAYQQPQHQPGGPQFFHAEDARSAISSHESDEKVRLPQKKNTFFYASGVPEEQDIPTSTVSTPVPNRSELGRFLRTSTQTSPPTITKSPPLSTTSSPHLPSPDVSRHAALRPPSPLKDLNAVNAPGISRGSYPPPINVATPSKPSAPITRPRQQSTGKPGQPGQPWAPSHNHRKSLSNVSQKSMSLEDLKTIQSPPLSPARIDGFAQLSSVSEVLLSTNNALSLDAQGSTVHFSADEDDIPPTSPSKLEPGAQGQLSKVSELAAKARRERKVLDLEISNSSLLAINRTLERELRKQSAELRRFRRLSRAGQLSAVTESVRSVSGQSAALSMVDESNDEEDSEGEELSESEEDSFESSLDENEIANLSPEAFAELDARHRAKDEKRLQLDLRKHQQLLIDSQKMNQSIRRCVAWTDELISEGKKALEYQVRVSDVELGGRVLSVEDELAETRKGLLSPTATIQQFEENQLWAGKLEEIQEILESVEEQPQSIPAELNA